MMNATPIPLAELQVHSSPPLLSDVRPDLPASIIRLASDCLAKDPTDRPFSAGALLGELRAIERSSATSAAYRGHGLCNVCSRRRR